MYNVGRFLAHGPWGVPARFLSVSFLSLWRQRQSKPEVRAITGRTLYANSITMTLNKFLAKIEASFQMQVLSPFKERSTGSVMVDFPRFCGVEEERCDTPDIGRSQLSAFLRLFLCPTLIFEHFYENGASSKCSLLKTLACKHHSSMKAQWRKYKASFQAANGTTYKCLEIQVPREGKKPLVARFGGIPLKRELMAILIDHPSNVARPERNELIKRLLAEKCELCGSRENVEVHHIRKLADLEKEGRKRPRWVKIMAARRRKTLVVCHVCHRAIHAGRPTQLKVSD